MTRRRRNRIVLACVLAAAALGPALVLLGRSNLQFNASQRRALVFDPAVWQAEAGQQRAENRRGLMVPGLLATGRLAGLSEGEARALLGEPDCPVAPGAGPFAGETRLAYWAGRVGSAKLSPGDPVPPPACLYLRLIDGRVVEWRTAPAPSS